MTHPPKLPLAAAAVALLLALAPASSLATEEPWQQVGPTASEKSTPSEATPAPAPATTQTAPAPGTGTAAQPPAAAAPTTTSPPASATAPLVSGQSAQGGTPSPAGAQRRSRGPRERGPRAPAKPKRSTGGSAARPKRGRRAPKPSALTPPLPLALSSSIAGVPGFFIESFRIPPFLLPIFQAAGTPRTACPGRCSPRSTRSRPTTAATSASPARAPRAGCSSCPPRGRRTASTPTATASRTRTTPPTRSSPPPAISAPRAPRPESARPIFAYNHSQAYVKSVMLRAKLLGGTPSELLGAITGLTEARFPVYAAAHFADGFPSVRPAHGATEDAARHDDLRGAGAPVIAVQDGEVVRDRRLAELGRFVSLRDAYGNTYTYARLGSVAELYPVLEPHDGSSSPSGPAQGPTARRNRSRGVRPALARTPARALAAAEAGRPLGALARLPDGLESAAPGGTRTHVARPRRARRRQLAGASATSGDGSEKPPRPRPAARRLAARDACWRSDARAFRAGPNEVYLHELRAGVQRDRRAPCSVTSGTAGGGAAAHRLPDPPGRAWERR